MFGKISHLNVVSVQFLKDFKGLLFCGESDQKTWNFKQTLFLVLAFQKNILSSFLLFSSVCYQDDLRDSKRKEVASLTACHLNNNSLLYVEFSGKINLCQNIWLIEN